MKNSNDTIWNRTSDLPICSTAREDPAGEYKLQIYYFFDLSASQSWVVNATPRPLYIREGDTVPIV
jgi:hypothetical protein